MNMVHSSRMRSVILVGLLTLTAAAACILPVRRIIGASTLSANAATEPAPAESPQGAGASARQRPGDRLDGAEGCVERRLARGGLQRRFTGEVLLPPWHWLGEPRVGNPHARRRLLLRKGLLQPAQIRRAQLFNIERPDREPSRGRRRGRL